MNAHHNDWTPDKVLDTVREYVDAGALSECAALDLLERLPLPLLGWTLEEYAQIFFFCLDVSVESQAVIKYHVCYRYC